MTTKPIGNRKTYLAPQFYSVFIIGVGGTGSYLAQGLAKMIAGYRLQVEVTLVDPDRIEEKNCARQNFQPWEIGEPKASALSFRLNQQYGLNFGALVATGQEVCSFHNYQSRLFVTCVDTVSARKHCKGCGTWLDMGNGVETGQALYGTTDDEKKLEKELKGWKKTPHVGHLPNPYRAFGMTRIREPRKKTPSCADTPFAEQGVFANEWAAAAGLTILHQLLVKGELSTPAIYFDAGKGRMVPEFITKEYLGRK